jgi:hypothetical protein
VSHPFVITRLQFARDLPFASGLLLSALAARSNRPVALQSFAAITVNSPIFIALPGQVGMCVNSPRPAAAPAGSASTESPALQPVDALPKAPEAPGPRPSFVC